MRSVVRVLCASALVAGLLASGRASSAATLNPSSARVSVSSAGAQSDGSSFLGMDISGDGRYVAFESVASNLVANDSNGTADVFVHDRVTGLTERASVGTAGLQANARSWAPRLSDDGRYVAFMTSASNLSVQGAGLYLRDRVAGTTTFVDGKATGPSLSGNGRYLAFVSDSDFGLTPAGPQVYVKDLTLGTVTRASLSSAGTPAAGGAGCAAISRDASTVAFCSADPAIVPGDTNGAADIFVRNLAAGTTTRVSLATSGAEPDADSSRPALNANGRIVAFESAASNLVAGDGAGTPDVFVRDLDAGTTRIASASADGVPAAGHSYGPDLSDDGRYVAFWSDAVALTPDRAFGATNTYRKDMQTGAVAWSSGTSIDDQTNGEAQDAAISGSGGTVAFVSSSSNIVSGDSNGSWDAFVHDHTAPGPGPGPFRPLTPVRVIDTRGGRGALGPGESMSVRVAGVGGVPTSGASAVAVNVTVVGPSSGGWLTVHPSGSARPLASNLNFAPGETRANLAIVRVGENGRITVNNALGSSHVIVDVSGWFEESSATGGSFVPMTPVRLLDTRDADGAHPGPLAPGENYGLQVTGVSGVPSSNVTAVAVNVTAVTPSSSGWLTVYPSGGSVPLASNLNFEPGRVVPNLVMASVGQNGKISINNPLGSTHVIVDIAGYYTSSPVSGGQYTAVAPARVLDTRTGTGGRTGALAPGESLTLTLAGTGGLPASGIGAVALNVTAVDPTASGWLTLHPAGRSLPLASNVNFDAGQTAPNMVVVAVDSAGKATVHNALGNTHVIFDVAGWFSS